MLIVMSSGFTPDDLVLCRVTAVACVLPYGSTGNTYFAVIQTS